MRGTARVFISYARSDGEQFATALRRRLEIEQAEITVWQDRARMEGGVGWWKQITEAIDNVEFLVLVMTPAAMRSEMARKEWRYARQQGVCVYPVKGASDAELQIDALPLWMRSSHFFDLQHEWDTFIHHLKSPCQSDRIPYMAPDLPARFVERPDLIKPLLDAILDPSHQDPQSGVVALHGAGGLGKTILATSVCHNEDVITAFADGILWVTLGEKPDLAACLAEVYAALTGQRPNFVNSEDAAIEVAGRLEDKHCLIVIDDVWSSAHLRPFLRRGPACLRLITTRQFPIAAEFAAQARCVRAQPMQSDQAVAMLLQAFETAVEDPEPIRTLAGRLGEWPLMLKLARGALIQRMALGDSVQGALRYVNRALDHKGVTVFDSENAEVRHDALRRTVDVSLDLLASDECQRCFELSIFPEDVSISIVTIGALWTMNEFDTEHLVQRLHGFSLLEFDIRSAFVRLHDLMRSYFAARLREEHPIHAKLLQSWGDPYKLADAYAWRWYVYHLVKANQREFAARLLTDFSWLLRKLEHTDPNSLISDYELLTDVPHLHFIQHAIRLSAQAIGFEHAELASQLLGRLRAYSPEVAALLEDAKGYGGRPWLRPLSPGLTPPGGPIQRILKGHGAPVRAVVISRDGKRAVSGSSVSDAIKIWDLANWMELRTLVGHTAGIYALDLDRAGKILISGSDDHTAKIWDAHTGVEKFALLGHSGSVRSVALAADAGLAVTGSFDNTVRVWDAHTGAHLITFSGHQDWIRAVAITEDGRWVVSSSFDGTLRVWDTQQGTEQNVFRFHRERARALALRPDSNWAVSGADDGSIRMWNILDGTVLSLRDHGDPVVSIAVAADGRRAVCASEDALSVWDLEDRILLRTFEGRTGTAEAVAIGPDGQCAITGSQDETLKIWDLNCPSTATGGRGHARWVNQVAIDSSGRRGMSGSYDGTVKVWDVLPGVELHNLAAFDGSIRAVAITPVRPIGISGSDSGILRVWDLLSGAQLGVSSEPIPAINTLATDTDGAIAITGSRDGSIRIWDVTTCTVKKTFRAHFNSITAAVLNANGSRALIASTDRSMQYWDLESQTVIHVLRGHADWVRALDITGDGRLAVSGSANGSIKLWDLESGLEIKSIGAGSFTINGIAIVGAGEMVVAAGGDHAVRLWDMNSGACVAVFTGDDVITSCALAGDDRTLIAGEASGNVHFLHIELK